MATTIGFSLCKAGECEHFPDYAHVNIWLCANGVHSHHNGGVIACMGCLDVCLDFMRSQVTVPAHAFVTEPLISEEDFDKRALEIKVHLASQGFRSHCSK